ncbi:MAG: hypothetical protein BZY87_01765 [SAR202 cluster bacterium Io17-Chloro-G6]|nr:MAG: hypothetical protein BZY87_01765 [SAR202 cluster bacterium Io17-Chloro-G6]
MNWLDLVILLVVGVGAAVGLKMGVVRAGLVALGILVGSVLGGQLSDDIGGLLSFGASNGVIATVLSYAAIISACLVLAAIASVVLQKVVNVLFLGWANKLAGVGLGVVTGVVISAGLIMGMANLTYSDEIGDEVAGKVLNATLDPEQARNRLETGLTGSTIVGVFINVVEVVPASTMGFVPSNFKSALEVVNLRKGSIGN